VIVIVILCCLKWLTSIPSSACTSWIIFQLRWIVAQYETVNNGSVQGRHGHVYTRCLQWRHGRLRGLNHSLTVVEHWRYLNHYFSLQYDLMWKHIWHYFSSASLIVGARHTLQSAMVLSMLKCRRNEIFKRLRRIHENICFIFKILFNI